MSSTRLTKSVRLSLAAACVALLAMAGCIPVGWLPDSSGFVYTDGRDLQQLVHYDLAKGERRVLVEKLPAITTWPALSPDGKQVAVARLKRDKNAKKTHTMQVLIYDLAGKEVLRSAEFPWTKDGKEADDELLVAGVFWIASAKKLIVHNYDDPVRTGLYDLEKKTMTVMDGYPCAFAGTPVRPDGKGFLIATEADNVQKAFFVDWEGKALPIDLKDNTSTNPEDRNSVLFFPWTGTSGWKGAVAEVRFKSLRITIDTEKRVGAYETIVQDQAMIDGKDIIQIYSFANGATLRVLHAMQNSDSFYHVEYLKKGEKKPTELKVQMKQSFIGSPAPNGKWVALRSMSDDKNILVIGETGDFKEIPGNNE